MQNVIIKQEKRVKNETPEEEEVKAEEVLSKKSSTVYEHMFNTVAAGMVVDELPKDLIPKFLEAIQEQP